MDLRFPQSYPDAGIEVNQLTIRFGDTFALRNVSLTIPARRLTVVVGPPGSGKTTLLKALSCELPWDSGSVSIQDVPARLWPPKKREACLSACPGLRPELCPLRDLLLCDGNLCSNPAGAMRSTGFRDALRLLGVMHLENRPAHGMAERDRLRIELALTLAPFLAGVEAPASHLWLDDPLDGMDRLHQHRLLGWLKRTAHRRQSTLVTASDHALVMGYADYSVLLSRGSQVAHGEPQDALSPQNLTRVFSESDI